MNRRLGVLFLVAAAGLLAIVGLALASLSWVVGVVYAVLVLTAVAVAARRVRRPALAKGQTCTCCTSTVHDPVKVV